MCFVVFKAIWCGLPCYFVRGTELDTRPHQSWYNGGLYLHHECVKLEEDIYALLLPMLLLLRLLLLLVCSLTYMMNQSSTRKQASKQALLKLFTLYMFRAK